jgi:hypothetical protein
MGQHGPRDAPMQGASVERGVVDEEMGVLPQDRPSRQPRKL